MVKELGISPTSTTDISLASFGSASRFHQKLGVATVEIDSHWGTDSYINTHRTHNCCTHPECCSHIRQHYDTFARTQVSPSSYLQQHLYYITLNWDRLLLEVCTRYHHQRRWPHSSGVQTRLSLIRATALLTPTGSNFYFTTDNIHSNT